MWRLERRRETQYVSYSLQTLEGTRSEGNKAAALEATLTMHNATETTFATRAQIIIDNACAGKSRHRKHKQERSRDLDSAPYGPETETERDRERDTSSYIVLHYAALGGVALYCIAWYHMPLHDIGVLQNFLNLRNPAPQFPMFSQDSSLPIVRKMLE